MESSIVTKLLILFQFIAQLLLAASIKLIYKWITYLSNIFITLKSVTFLNEGTFSRTLSLHDLPVIFKLDKLQSLTKPWSLS